IAGNRLGAREHAETEVLDLELEAVDLAIDVERLLCEIAVALGQRAHGALEHLLDLRAHHEEHFANATQLAFVFAVGVEARHGFGGAYYFFTRRDRPTTCPDLACSHRG